MSLNSIMLPEVVLTADKKKPFGETAFGGFFTDFLGNMSNQGQSTGTTSAPSAPINFSSTSPEWNPEPLQPLAPLPPVVPKTNNTPVIVLTSLVVLGLTGYVAYSYSKKTTSKKKSLSGVMYYFLFLLLRRPLTFYLS